MVWPLRFSRAAPGRRPRIEGAEGGRLSIDGNIDGGEALFIDARVNGVVFHVVNFASTPLLFA